jgi:hypothetical protein
MAVSIVLILPYLTSSIKRTIAAYREKNTLGLTI